MGDVYAELDVRGLSQLFPEHTINAQLENDLFLARMRFVSEKEVMDRPQRFDAYLIFLCYGGSMDVEINGRIHHMEAYSMLVYTPHNVLRVHRIVPQPGKIVHYAVAAISSELMANSRINFNRIYQQSLRFMDNPAIRLSRDEMNVCREYFGLIMDLASRSLPGIREAVIMAISSVFYWAGALWQDRVSEAQRNVRGDNFRARAVFEDFLRLVQDHHMTERSLGFYADKLYMSPKYLSKLVKNVSGRSAHDWIDLLVIRQAQNLLKYSDLPIKQIVTQLNFPNQTTFYRFFKIQTGQTPTEYRKS